MAEFDFKTVAVVIGAVLSPSVIFAFKELFEKPNEHATKVLNALRNPLPPGLVWMRNRRKDLLKSLLFVPRLALSFFFLSLTVGVGVLLVAGPETVLDPGRWGTLAEPLTSGERLLYWILLVPTIAAYIWKVCVPVYNGWNAVVRATCWIRKR